MNKAELARQSGVSRAYVTMLCNGKRKPGEKISHKIDSLNISHRLGVERQQ